MKAHTLVTALVTILFLGSCSTKDEQFCRCLQLGSELNDATNTTLNEAVSEAKAQKVRELIARQKKECAAYHQLDGTKLKELQQSCGTN